RREGSRSVYRALAITEASRSIQWDPVQAAADVTDEIEHATRSVICQIAGISSIKCSIDQDVHDAEVLPAIGIGKGEGKGVRYAGAADGIVAADLRLSLRDCE